MQTLNKYRPVLVLLIIIAIAPLITSILHINFLLTQLTMAGYYLLAAIGLCMLMGYAGQISLGQAGFFAIGGYTSALLTTLNWMKVIDNPFGHFLTFIGIFVSGKDLYGSPVVSMNPWAAMIAAVILAAGTAFFIGIPVLKLKGHYLAMATLGFGVIIEKIVRGTRLFGGADGISNVPPFQILPFININGDMETRIPNFYFAWFVVILGLFLITNLLHSRVGRALRSLHDGTEAADAMGVDTAGYKLNIFVLGAVFAALAGIFLTHYNGSIGPGEASVMKSVRYVSIVAVGGMANLWGTVITGLVLNFLSLRGIFGSYDDAVFGAILVLVMIFAPDGFIRSNMSHKKKGN